MISPVAYRALDEAAEPTRQEVQLGQRQLVHAALRLPAPEQHVVEVDDGDPRQDLATHVDTTAHEEPRVATQERVAHEGGLRNHVLLRVCGCA
jgi:hypothetical protein